MQEQSIAQQQQAVAYTTGSRVQEKAVDGYGVAVGKAEKLMNEKKAEFEAMLVANEERDAQREATRQINEQKLKIRTTATSVAKEGLEKVYRDKSKQHDWIPYGSLGVSTFMLLVSPYWCALNSSDPLRHPRHYRYYCMVSG